MCRRACYRIKKLNKLKHFELPSVWRQCLALSSHLAEVTETCRKPFSDIVKIILAADQLITVDSASLAAEGATSPFNDPQLWTIL